MVVGAEVVAREEGGLGILLDLSGFQCFGELLRIARTADLLRCRRDEGGECVVVVREDQRRRDGAQRSHRVHHSVDECVVRIEHRAAEHLRHQVLHLRGGAEHTGRRIIRDQVGGRHRGVSDQRHVPAESLEALQHVSERSAVRIQGDCRGTRILERLQLRRHVQSGGVVLLVTGGLQTCGLQSTGHFFAEQLTVSGAAVQDSDAAVTLGLRVLGNSASGIGRTRSQIEVERELRGVRRIGRGSHAHRENVVLLEDRQNRSRDRRRTRVQVEVRLVPRIDGFAQLGDGDGCVTRVVHRSELDLTATDPPGFVLDLTPAWWRAARSAN